MAPRDYLFNPERNPLIRGDYRPHEYRIPAASLNIDLDETNTGIRCTMTVEPNPAANGAGGPLFLNGEDLKLKSIRIKENGAWRELDRSEYLVDKEGLTFKRPPAGKFELQIENDIDPAANTKLSGIYTSGAGIISSQNEAQGFRRITYFIDRPDNLTVFDATIEADKAKYPVLLANGNGDPNATTDLGNGRHSIHWADPWPKPSYLFAMVAGPLKVLEDEFITMSGKHVDLRIYVQDGYEDKVQWAMEATKRAMRWDEVRYGREYDLDNFHIVAVDKFNAGAMENKGLNIFNVARLVGNPETSTDTDLMDIEEVIGHEYFHNWTGDRVTVRDWFEISLKESLTSLRQRQFASDMHSAAVKLIDDATLLRTGQFIEDSGPSSHCVRPDRVEEFDNIYSTTVYQKGKHVLNMMNTILGDQMWRTAMDNYFIKFDGQAVTVDDFIDNMQDTSGIDLTQFRRWYSQSGTPEVSYEGKYDPVAKTYTLTLSQHTPATADQPLSEKQPLHIPVSVGLIGQSGKDVPLVFAGTTPDDVGLPTTRVLNLTKEKQTWVFDNVPGPVVPSILRGFSAPVKITTQPSDDELIFRMAHDSDPFNKFEAKERLMLKTMLGLIQDVQDGKQLKLPQAVVDAFGANLAGAPGGDGAFSAQMLSLPAYNIIIQNLKTVDPDAITKATKFMSKTLTETFKDEFERIYAETQAPAGEKYDVVPAQVGRRALHNLSLSYLSKLDAPAVSLAQSQYKSSKNMTEKLGALSTLARMEGGVGEKALDNFYQTYKTNNNLVDRWLTLKAATASGPGAADEVRKLLDHEAFDIENPNKVRALMGGFASGNPGAFHAKDGSGYKLLADVVVSLNKVNGRVAAQIVRPLTQFKRYDAKRQELMLAELQRIMETPNLDKGLKEVVGQTLATAEKKPQASASFNKPKDDAPGHTH